MSKNDDTKYIETCTSTYPRHRVEITQIVSVKHYIQINHDVEVLPRLVRDGIDMLQKQSVISSEDASVSRQCLANVLSIMEFIKPIPETLQSFLLDQIRNNLKISNKTAYLKNPFAANATMPLIISATAYLGTVKSAVFSRITKENISLLCSVLGFICTTHVDPEIIRKLNSFSELLGMITLAFLIMPVDKN